MNDNQDNIKFVSIELIWLVIIYANTRKQKSWRTSEKKVSVKVITLHTRQWRENMLMAKKKNTSKLAFKWWFFFLA